MMPRGATPLTMSEWMNSSDTYAGSHYTTMDFSN
jgi:hypothetical protein